MARGKINGTAKKNGAQHSIPEGAVTRGVEMRPLPVPISDVEVAILAKELGQVIGDRESLDAEIREFVGERREEIKELKKRETELAASVRQHTRLQDTKCVLYLLPNNEIQIVRVDTGEVVDRRPPTAAELQVDIEDALETHPDSLTVE